MNASKRRHNPVTAVTRSGDRNHGISFCLCRTLRTTRWTMRAIEAGVRLALKNILLLTDFSEPSEIAVPFAIAIAREYESKVYAMHVLTPVPLAYATPESAAAAIVGLEEGAQAGMQRVDAQLVGVPHETMLVRAESVWSPIEQALSECEIDLVILGTH